MKLTHKRLSKPFVIIFISILILIGILLTSLFFKSEEVTETEDSSALTVGAPEVLDTNKFSKKAKNSILKTTLGEKIYSDLIEQSSKSGANYKLDNKATTLLNSTTNTGSIKQKILLIIYDTHLLSPNNTYPYYDPLQLNNQLEKAMQVASKERGFLNDGISSENVDIQIVDTIIYRSSAPQRPGTTTPNHRTFDYMRMIDEHNVCNRVNSGSIDEVWLWADRTGGFAEALMAGPTNQVYNSNGQPFIRNDCSKAVHIMGFNYERTVDLAIHSMGHRGESVLSVFLDNTKDERPGDTSYEYMGVQSPYTPGEGWVHCVDNKGYVGNIHCTPNSRNQYIYNIQETVNSDFKEWTPQHLGNKSIINSSFWESDPLFYYIYWFQNFPSKEYAPYLTQTDGQPMLDMWTAFYKNQFLVPPKIYRCNTVCSQDSECSNANPNWFCSQQYNYGPWVDDSHYLTTIQYTLGNETKTESGINYGLNQQIKNGVTEQHLVKNNKLFFRTNTPGVGWSVWTDQTANVANVGCNLFTDCGGNIVGFNTYYKLSGKYEQHLLRRSATSFKLFSRNNDNGWSPWVDVTANVSGVGTGTFTSFTSYVHPDGYTLQNIVRGGVLWERTNLGGWKSWGINNGLNSCAGTGTNKCGNTTLISYEKSYLPDGRDQIHIFREGNKNYSRTSNPTDQRCRLNTNRFSNTCS